MNDDLGLFRDTDESAGYESGSGEGPRSSPYRVEPPSSSRLRGSRGGRRSRPPRWGVFTVVVVVLLVLGAAVWFGLREIASIGDYADYTGPGASEVLFEVRAGESTRAIGVHMHDAGIVASAEAFVAAGEGNADVRAIQPGYYVMRKHMSGNAAVGRITAPSAAVGQVEIRPGSRLEDVTMPDGSTRAGILSRLAKASCARLNGASTCVPANTLRKVAAENDPAALGVPDWALPSVRHAPDGHRLEGLIAPGIYHVRPGDTAKELLKSVLAESTKTWRAEGMPDLAKDTGFTPYQLLTIASLSQSEAVEADFGKVARVTMNRLAAGKKLEYDSTVNYVLDRPQIRTKDSDRAKAGPYNTYVTPGLPPTPISSPSNGALKAAANPPHGQWMFFVKCHKNGSSCFAKTVQQHRRNVRKAHARGVF